MQLLQILSHCWTHALSSKRGYAGILKPKLSWVKQWNYPSTNTSRVKIIHQHILVNKRKQIRIFITNVTVCTRRIKAVFQKNTIYWNEGVGFVSKHSQYCFSTKNSSHLLQIYEQCDRLKAESAHTICKRAHYYGALLRLKEGRRMVQPPRAAESKGKQKKINKFKVLEANQRKINTRLQFC